MSADIPKDAASDDAEVTKIASDIEGTRAQMGETLSALEQRLSPSELGKKAGVELDHVEVRVKAAVKEGLAEAKQVLDGEIQTVKEMLGEKLETAKGAVREEIGVVKDAVNEQIHETKDLVTKGLSDARAALKEDIRHAITSTKQGIRDATLGRVENFATQAGDVMNTTRDTLFETVRQNPLPAALAGIGIAWLLMNRSSAASRPRERAVRGGDFGSRLGYDEYEAGHDGYGRRGASDIGVRVSRAVGGAQHAVSDAAGAVAHGASAAASQVGSAVGSAAGAVSTAAHDAAEAARSGLSHGVDAASHFVDATGKVVQRAGAATNRAVHDASDAIGHFAHDASDSIGHFAHDAGSAASQQAQRLGRGFQSTLHTNPLAVGAAALALGAAFGYALPRTQREDELMGEARNRVLESASHVVHDVAESVQHLAGDAREGVKDALATAAD